MKEVDLGIVADVGTMQVSLVMKNFFGWGPKEFSDANIVIICACISGRFHSRIFRCIIR